MRNTVFLGMGYQFFFKILETWFAKTNKCKSGVPRKKHFYKGSVLCVCERERGFWLRYFITTLLFCCCFVLFFVLCRIQLFFAHCSKSDSGMNHMYLWCIYIYMT